MCDSCGCSDHDHARVTVLDPATDGEVASHGHSHSAHHHTHSHDHAHGKTIQVEEDVLAKNNLLAQRNRGWFEGREILALNLVSSPGSGKTTLLEQTIREFSDKLPVQVIEGDQETTRDAQRIQSTGCRVVQINTGTGCHLDAHMLTHGLDELQPPRGALVLIENVGNLVCPALFDLGEYCKVAILSVTEGDDKPAKYPHMFRASEVLLMNKIDLLPHVDFDVERCIDLARQVNPQITVIQLSAKTGEGMDAWFAWLNERLPAQSAAAG